MLVCQKCGFTKEGSPDEKICPVCNQPMLAYTELKKKLKKEVKK